MNQKLEHLPYDQLVKKVENLEKKTKPLYEHRVLIRKQYSDSSVNSFNIWLTLYRHTNETLGIADIYGNVSAGILQNLNINDDPVTGFRVPLYWGMTSNGKISITCYVEGGTHYSFSVTQDQYDIIDTVIPL
jgi:hypothetical protein